MYRDDLQAAHDRIGSLEAENAKLKQEVAAKGCGTRHRVTLETLKQIKVVLWVLWFVGLMIVGPTSPVWGQHNPTKALSEENIACSLAWWVSGYVIYWSVSVTLRALNRQR